MRCDIEVSFSGQKSSAKTVRGPSGNVSHRTTTACKEKERLHHNMQLLLLSEEESSVSVKPLDTEPAECETNKLSADELKSLIDMDSKPQNMTGKPSESYGFGNLRCQSNSEARDVEGDKQEVFDPFAEGTELSLPSKYRKLKATSIKLYSDLRNNAESRDKSPPCQYFLHRLETEFDMENISTHKEIQDRTNTLLEEHEKWLRLTGDMVSRSYKLSEDSPWQEVYKCYRHWQIVLSKFNELQRRTQQLLEGKKY